MIKPISIYIAGAIERSKDYGVGIRKEIKREIKRLFNNKDVVKIIDPCDFKYNQGKYPTMLSYQEKKSHNLSSCVRHCSVIVDGDIKAVKGADIIIVLLDENCGAGTASEVTVAKDHNKIVLGYFLNERWKNVSPWILSRVDEFFYSKLSLMKEVSKQVTTLIEYRKWFELLASYRRSL